MNLRQLLTVLVVAALAVAVMVAPVLVASHLLVKGLKDELEHDNSRVHLANAATNMLKKLVTECSSDVYLLVNQPGLRYTDLQDSKKLLWPFIQKYLTLASTVVGLPRVNEGLDLDYLENYIVKTCDAEIISVMAEDENEVNKYIDIRKRVIRVELGPLPEDEDPRNEAIAHHDELIRRILRKAPSPHYTIVLTSTTTSNIHPIPPGVIEQDMGAYEIFDEVVNSPWRQQEVERNDRFKEVRPDWNEDRNTVGRYLRNRQKDEVHLFRGNDVWQQREKLVATFAVMVMGLVLVQTWRWTERVRKRKGD